MGLFSKRSFSSYDGPLIESRLPDTRNPDPNRYEIIRAYELDGHLVIEIRYPNCTNYEGRKILVFKNCNKRQLLAQGSIDPHFSNNKNMKSPFARFEPTKAGWDAAFQLIKGGLS